MAPFMRLRRAMMEARSQAPTGRWELGQDEMVVLARIAARFPHLAHAETELVEAARLRQRVSELEQELRVAQMQAAHAAQAAQAAPRARSSRAEWQSVNARQWAQWRPTSVGMPREDVVSRLVRLAPSIGWAMAWRLGLLIGGPMIWSALPRDPRLVLLAVLGVFLLVTAGRMATHGGVGALWRVVLGTAVVGAAFELRGVPFQVAFALSVVVGVLLALDGARSVLRRG